MHQLSLLPQLPPPPSPPATLHRFWGTPIPIWASEDGEEIRVIGSIEELAAVAGRPVSGGAQAGITYNLGPFATRLWTLALRCCTAATHLGAAQDGSWCCIPPFSPWELLHFAQLLAGEAACVGMCGVTV
jgi:hypothetical protein